MFKRVIWFGSGVASGVVGSWWTKRKIKKQADKFQSGLSRSDADVDGTPIIPVVVKEQAAKQVRRVADRTSKRASAYLGEDEEPQTSAVASAASAASSTIERYRGQARDKFFERRRRGNIKPVPD